MDRDTPTLVTCPACDGRGGTLTETSTGYSGSRCEVCDASGVVTPAQARAWQRSRRETLGGLPVPRKGR